MKWFWVSTTKATCAVECDDRLTIISTCPFFSKFKGQHLTNLLKWSNLRLGNLQVRRMK